MPTCRRARSRPLSRRTARVGVDHQHLVGRSAASPEALERRGRAAPARRIGRDHDGEADAHRPRLLIPRSLSASRSAPCRGGAGRRGASSGRHGPGQPAERELVAGGAGGLDDPLVVEAVRIREGAARLAGELLDRCLRLRTAPRSSSASSSARRSGWVSVCEPSSMPASCRARRLLGVEQRARLAGHVGMLCAEQARADEEASRARRAAAEHGQHHRQPVAPAVVEREARPSRRPGRSCGSSSAVEKAVAARGAAAARGRSGAPATMMRPVGSSEAKPTPW